MEIYLTAIAEKQYLAKVAELPCCLCGDWPVHIHHIRHSQGMSQRASNWLAVPLCPSCHQGPQGVHGDKTMLRIMKMDELDMLADTIRRLLG